MDNFFGSICLSDIPKELIRTAKNGKKYLSVLIRERKEPSQYGQTHFIKAYVKKEDEKEGVNYFIGEFSQPKTQEKQTISDAKALASQRPEEEDLPF